MWLGLSEDLDVHGLLFHLNVLGGVLLPGINRARVKLEDLRHPRAGGEFEFTSHSLSSPTCHLFISFK